MNDAFGGSFLMKLFIIFLGIFIVFMGISVAYSKAFQTKDRIITMIQRNNGFDKDNSNMVNSINNEIGDYGYFQNIGDDTSICSGDDKYDNCFKSDIGYVIQTKCVNLGAYYRVTTYIGFEIPFFGINIRIPIVGETKVMNDASICGGD